MSDRAMRAARTGRDGVASHPLYSRTRTGYPATRAQIVEACFDCGDRNEGERTWLLATLPDRLFESADQILTALLA